MKTVNMHEAETHLSRLVEGAAGQPFVIAKAESAMVKVVPPDPQATAPQRLGFYKGSTTAPNNFDTMRQDKIERMFGVTD